MIFDILMVAFHMYIMSAELIFLQLSMTELLLLRILYFCFCMKMTQTVLFCQYTILTWVHTNYCVNNSVLIVICWNKLVWSIIQWDRTRLTISVISNGIAESMYILWNFTESCYKNCMLKVFFYFSLNSILCSSS